MRYMKEIEEDLQIENGDNLMLWISFLYKEAESDQTSNGRYCIAIFETTVCFITKMYRLVGIVFFCVCIKLLVKFAKKCKMMRSRYEEVKIEEREIAKKFRRSWTPLLRQLFVCSGVWVLYFVLGLCFGAPTVFIPRIRKEANSTDAISVDMESWLTSVHGYSALPFVVMLPIFTQYVGRKIPFLVVCVNTILGFIIFYWSVNTMQLLISEIVQGMLLASNMTLLIVIVTEYTSPHYRGVLMAIESGIFFWGVWVANFVGTFFHWKNIGIIAFVCCGYCLSALFWPESPSWLALKGRFDECAASHHWLKGYDPESEKELQNLIKSQREHLEARSRRKVSSYKEKLRIIIETAKTRGFYQPLLLAVAVMSLYHFSGKLVCTMYAVELIRKITNNENTAYMGMLIMEGVTIFGMELGCVLSRYLRRRTLLLVFSAIGICFLFMISLYLYLIKIDIIAENQYLSIGLMNIFSVTISCGPMIVPSTLFGEIIFLQYKSSSLLILALYSEFLMATVLKMSPHIFKIFTLPGAFFFYGVSASVFSIILYKYLPETKDKTLHEIEGFFKDQPRLDSATRELM